MRVAPVRARALPLLPPSRIRRCCRSGTTAPVVPLFLSTVWVSSCSLVKRGSRNRLFLRSLRAEWPVHEAWGLLLGLLLSSGSYIHLPLIILLGGTSSFSSGRTVSGKLQQPAPNMCQPRVRGDRPLPFGMFSAGAQLESFFLPVREHLRAGKSFPMVCQVLLSPRLLTTAELRAVTFTPEQNIGLKPNRCGAKSRASRPARGQPALGPGARLWSWVTLCRAGCRTQGRDRGLLLSARAASPSSGSSFLPRPVVVVSAAAAPPESPSRAARAANPRARSSACRRASAQRAQRARAEVRRTPLSSASPSLSLRPTARRQPAWRRQ